MVSEILHYGFAGIVVLLLFNLTIFIHELGHYLVGRWRGAKIERFAVWFGPALWSRTINGVEFRLGCIPLGGYVAFPQLAMEAIEGKSETPVEELKPLRPRDKIPILLAGSVFNVFLGIVIATMVFGVGVPKDPSELDLRVGYLSEESNEWKAGIRPGDLITSINGKKVQDHEEILERVALSTSETVRVGLIREGQSMTVAVVPSRNPGDFFNIRRLRIEPPETPIIDKVMSHSPAEKAGLQHGDEVQSIEGEKVLGRNHMSELISKRDDRETRVRVLRGGKSIEVSLIPRLEESEKRVLNGIQFGSREGIKPVVVHPTPWRQIKKSIISMFDTFNALLHSKTTGVGVKDLSGPVGIAQHLFLRTILDVRLTLAFIVLLNINLAIVNLLPIPVLDGGHIVFSIIEAIRRRPLNARFVEITQTVFVVLLLSFMAYVTFNDFVRMKGINEFRSKAKVEETNAPKEFREAKPQANP